MGTILAKGFRLPAMDCDNTSQTAENLTDSRDNNLEQTPPSIEADMNS
jgi:hypothetical protein